MMQKKKQWWKPNAEQENADILLRQLDREVAGEPTQMNGTQTSHTKLDCVIASAGSRAQQICEQVKHEHVSSVCQDNAVPDREKEACVTVTEPSEELTQERSKLQRGVQTGIPPKKRKRKSAGRTNQVMTRLTDSELVTLQRRIAKSGLAQGEYLRQAALCGQIVIVEQSVADVGLLDDLALIRAELGRQGGLLKMIIKPNEGQRELNPAEWSDLIAWIRCQEKTKQQLSELERKVLRGDHKT